MKRKNNVLIVLISIIALGFLTSTIVLIKQNKDLKNDPTYVKLKKAQKTDTLRKKVAKLINLPANEKAFIGTYDAKSSLKDNPFFKEAKDGDKYLIFSESGKAIIYRESENKLINVGPIAITSEKNVEETKEATENRNDRNSRN